MHPDFPPPQQPLLQAVLLHLMFSLLVLAPIVGLFFKSRRPARPSDIGWSLAVVGIATVAIVNRAKDFPPQFNPFIDGCMLIAWSVVGIDCLLTIVRLRKQGDSVIAAIGWLFGSLVALVIMMITFLPPLEMTRGESRLAQCKINLKRIGLAMHKWHDTYGRFPDATLAKDDQPPMSWRVALLPYLGADEEFNSLFERYDPSQPWNSETNHHIAQTAVSLWHCPSADPQRDEQGRWFTAYVMPVGPQTAFPNGQGLVLEEMTNGASQTLIVAEACGLQIPWTQPQDFETDDGTVDVTLLGGKSPRSSSLLSSHHFKGANILMADGSVRYVSAEVSPGLLNALLTPTGKDQLEPEQLSR